MSRTKLTAAGIVLPAALIAALLGFLLFDEDQAACIPAGSAVVVDPGSVPAGPVRARDWHRKRARRVISSPACWPWWSQVPVPRR